MKTKIVTVDVREDLQNGREPFGKIMGAVAALRGDERLRLLAPFEPLPLMALLANRGLAHAATRTPAGDWEVMFTREADLAPAGDCGCGCAAPNSPDKPIASRTASARGTGGAGSSQPEIVDVDARGLEPPQPLVVILEALAGLPAGAELRARTDRRPMHLHAPAAERGFNAQTEEQPDGSFLTQIKRR